MSKTTSIALQTDLPLLADIFDRLRPALEAQINSGDLSAPQIVTAARTALDRTGRLFIDEVTDPDIKRAALWLVEMVKSGAGIVDSAAGADIIWHEVTPEPTRSIGTRSAFFYLVALGLFLLSYADGSRLGMASAAILAALRLVDSDILTNFTRRITSRIPFMKRPEAIADQSGRKVRAEARLRVRGADYASSLSEALKTADQVLLRLAEPEADHHWRDDRRLMSFIQALIEAGQAQDGDFALTLIGKQLDSLLAAEGVRKISYSPKTAELFDVLPAMGSSGTRLAAPALMAGDEVICRGTVWTGDMASGDTGDAHGE